METLVLFGFSVRTAADRGSHRRRPGAVHHGHHPAVHRSADPGHRPEDVHLARQIRPDGDSPLRPGGQLSLPGGGGQADHPLRPLPGRPPARWPADVGDLRLHHLRRGQRLLAGDRGRDRIDHDRRHPGGRLQQLVLGRLHRLLRFARHPDSAVHHPHRLRRHRRPVDRPTLHGRGDSWNLPRRRADGGDLPRRPSRGLPKPTARLRQGDLGFLQGRFLGPGGRGHHHRRHLRRPLHPHRGGRGLGRLWLLRRQVHLQGPFLETDSRGHQGLGRPLRR